MLHRCKARIGRVKVAICVASIPSIALISGHWGARKAYAQLPTVAARSSPAAGATAQVVETTDSSIGVDDASYRTPFWLIPTDSKQIPILAYPPVRSHAPAPLMVMLHGMCDAPQNECPSFAMSSTSNNWLVCPRANLQCEGGGTIWSGEPKVRSALVEQTLQRLRAAFPGRVDEVAAATLVGFSLGSFVAVDVAQRSRGQWKNLLLVGAKIEPDARLLTEAGVENVLLASGDRDMMKWHMVGVASRLQRRGVRASYMSMGNVGHWFADDMDGWLAKAMQWFAGPQNAALVSRLDADATARKAQVP
jgi:predicted esterase